jgi:hypothetical protein
MDVTKTCLLCGLDFGDGDFVTISRGLDTLRRCSDEKGDGLRATMDLHTGTMILNTTPSLYTINQVRFLRFLFYVILRVMYAL